MNKLRLQDIVRGQYGRKVAYTDYEEVNTSNIVKIFQGTRNTFENNKRVAEYLWNYYLGDQPALYRTKTIRDDVNNPVVENHAFEVVQFKTGQTYGEPVMCVSVRKDDTINKGVDILNDYFRASGKYAKDITCGEWQSAVGTGFKAMQRKNGEIPFRITVPTPLDTYIVYQRSTQEPLVAFQQLKDVDGKTYYKAFSEFSEFTIRDDMLVALGEGVYSRPHVFGGIPIVEYPNNASRLSDIELVVSMFDAINEIQSNRTDAIEQFVQSFFKFVNCDVDREKFETMKNLGAFVVNSTEDSKNADVGLVTQELNQTQSQVVKEDLWNNAMAILAIPNREGNTGGDTAGAVALRNGWDDSKIRANIKDAYVKDSEKQFALLVINRIRQTKGATECPIGIMDFEVNIPHSPTDNLLTKSQALQLLLSSGIHPLVAIKASGIWSDAEKVFLNSTPYLDAIYKTIDEQIKEQGLETELEKAKELIANGDKTV